MKKHFPGDFFHRTHTSMGQRLEHPLVACDSLPGFATREIALTEGPVDCIEPAVVCLEGFATMGLRFFVADRGVIATDGHVARADPTLTATLPSGAQLPAKLVALP